jgi:hypothetical protein
MPYNILKVPENELPSKTILKPKTIELHSTAEWREVIWAVITSTFRYSYHTD